MSSRSLPNSERSRTANIKPFDAAQRVNYARRIGWVVRRRLDDLGTLVRLWNTLDLSGPSVSDISHALKITRDQAIYLSDIALAENIVGRNRRGLFVIDHVEAAL